MKLEIQSAKSKLEIRNSKSEINSKDKKKKIQKKTVRIGSGRVASAFRSLDL
jgi:hypothetical protein